MRYLTEKSEALRNAGFVYDYLHMAYVNRANLKYASIDYVEKSSIRDLQTMMDSPREDAWQFFFLGHHSEERKAEIVRQIEEKTG